jgi:hypothetical protein
MEILKRLTQIFNFLVSETEEMKEQMKRDPKKRKVIILKNWLKKYQ